MSKEPMISGINKSAITNEREPVTAKTSIIKKIENLMLFPIFPLVCKIKLILISCSWMVINKVRS